MVEIHEGIGRPESVAKFFSCDHFAGMLDQHAQHLKGLFLKPQLDSILAQFACRNIHLEGSETQDTWKLGLRRHNNSEEVYTRPIILVTFLCK
jgi:hypothetical protein